MLATIEIKKLEIMAKHGVLPIEKKKPQPFVFNVTLSLNYLQAAKSDDIKDTISYCDIMKDIEEFTTTHCFNLIETLAYRCAIYLLNKYPQIEKISLSVSKPQAPFDMAFETVETKVNLAWHKVYLSLGSNMGKKQVNLNKALKLLASDEIKVGAVSKPYKNPPYGGVATNDFINLAAEVDTILSPYDLLDRIHEIEAKLGRVRTVRWGNRPIDIDIIFYDDIKMNTKDLTIPHKDYKNRDFVIVPLSEIAPHLF